jgi:hypothetical protein
MVDLPVRRGSHALMGKKRGRQEHLDQVTGVHLATPAISISTALRLIPGLGDAENARYQHGYQRSPDSPVVAENIPGRPRGLGDPLAGDGPTPWEALDRGI